MVVVRQLPIPSAEKAFENAFFKMLYDASTSALITSHFNDLSKDVYIIFSKSISCK
ncbi:MAG: hypothetical protein KAX10_05800 [Candidatus Lokiarchaeota archaeon]|nr:hypothetical protein [Candidatus Lokiarchaeota archaeon]